MSKEVYLYIFFIFLYDKESPPELLQSSAVLASASIVAKLQFKDETGTGYHLGEAAISVHHDFCPLSPLTLMKIHFLFGLVSIELALL